jgi:drug/metabolite transporter (DMT)-like permease
MAFVILAAVLQAGLFLLFRVFEQRRVELLPAIAVNYVVATLFGCVIAPPWHAGTLSSLWLPSAGIGMLFVFIFYLTGITAQRSGVVASTVASKMSVVLTVLFAVIVHHERPGPWGWTGLVFAVIGVVLASLVKGPSGARGAWWLPAVLFIGTACIDIALNATQRTLVTPATEAVFPILCTASAGVVSFAYLIYSGSLGTLRRPSAWIGGSLLGILNYGTLYFVVKALARSGLQASVVFLLISVGVILCGTFASMLLFQERPTRAQYIGIGCAVIAIVLLIMAP